MKNQFERTCLTFGRENMEKIFASRVIVFGIGGVVAVTVIGLHSKLSTRVQLDMRQRQT